MKENPNFNKDNNNETEKTNVSNGEEKTFAQKPSRTDRSTKAKEAEEKENHNLGEKLPKKYSEKNKIEIQEANE